MKPGNYVPFVSFSIAVFDALAEMGWARFTGDLSAISNTTVESFPLSAWRSLGIPFLPAKKKAHPEDLTDRLDRLMGKFKISLSRFPNHDELQALVSGLAGISMQKCDWAGIRMDGVQPFVLEGTVREGYIVNPLVPSPCGRSSFS